MSRRQAIVVPPAAFAPYVWVPGEGPDVGAVERLCRSFTKPKTPMGEAWFMSEQRQMFPELAGDLARLKDERLAKPLQELASGPAAFGPREEWTDWYHYLMPRLLPRAHEGLFPSIYELLVTAFFTQHPRSGGPQPYPGFFRDSLLSLGRVLMGPECWPGGRIDFVTALHKYHVRRVDRWFWEEASGRLSCAMFFILKYLEAQEVAGWMRSVLAIRSTHWRAQVMVWLVGAHPMLTGAWTQPAEFDDTDYPSVRWLESHVLQGHYTGDYTPGATPEVFLPPENREAAIAAVRSVLAEIDFASWLESLSRYDYLEGELADIPFTFHRLYWPG